jgi:hypothetical protein
MHSQNLLFVLNVISEPDENSLFHGIVKQYFHSHEQIVCSKGIQFKYQQNTLRNIYNQS